MNNSDKLVSIIIPVYNVEKYLVRCLNSLVTQTLDHLEILVVNDGSRDNSQTIIEEFARKYPSKVRGYKKENGGLGSARNYGLEFAKGEYIGFIDGDDYARPNMFAKMYKKAKQINADLVICQFDFVNNKGEHISTTNIIGHSDLLIDDKHYAHKYGRTEIWNKLYHRDLFFKTAIRFPNGGFGFDDYATTPLLVESAHKIAYIEEPLMYYVQRKDSMMGQIKYNSFSETSFAVLRMTEIIAQNKVKFEPANYQFFMDQIVPIHTFLKFVLPIVSIENKQKRADVIKRWGKELNRLIPNWYKSTAIKNKLRSMPFIRRLALMLIIFVFRFSIPFVIGKVKFKRRYRVDQHSL